MNGNLLINETSLYLLQHAGNPVNWHPWNDIAFEKARSENKLILISIGYSSCHWCHVMEKECFEDNEVAELMNDKFINIKVDREERPDVDQIYMSAVQIMGVQGGWPLNCFVLPDGRPIYGGTYFNKEQWLRVLNALSVSYADQGEKVEEYAEKVHSIMENKEWLQENTDNSGFSVSVLEQIVSTWASSFDKEHGGFAMVPKFPMPVNFISLFYWGLKGKDMALVEHVHKTLMKIGSGGIYDHLAGGFSRYSTDERWKVPHFEKMLYDNAQLLELYSLAYMAEENEAYKRVVYDSFSWLVTELKSRHGGFYCSLDADSNGKEGEFYVWSEAELKELLRDDYSWFTEFYNLVEDEKWEGHYILFSSSSPAEFAIEKGWTEEEFLIKAEGAKRVLLDRRSKRERPLRDTKCLTSWNALLIKGLCKAFMAFRDERFLSEAKEIADWICSGQLEKGSTLFHNSVEGEPSIDGFLEDYSFVIDAFIQLYQLNADLRLLELAFRLAETVEKDFYCSEHKMCYYTNSKSSLVTRNFDTEDDVIPSSNSVMAHNFYTLGTYYRKDSWVEIAKEMLAVVLPSSKKYPSSYANWFLLYFRFTYGIQEISFLDSKSMGADELHALVHPLRIISYHNELPMSSDFESGIYVCTDNTCWPRISSLNELKEKLGKK